MNGGLRLRSVGWANDEIVGEEPMQSLRWRHRYAESILRRTRLLAHGRFWGERRKSAQLYAL
jgi:hypothetical protein